MKRVVLIGLTIVVAICIVLITYSIRVHESESERYLRKVARCQFVLLGEYMNSSYDGEFYVVKKFWIEKVLTSAGIELKCGRALVLSKQGFYDALGREIKIEFKEGSSEELKLVREASKQGEESNVKTIVLKNGKIKLM